MSSKTQETISVSNTSLVDENDEEEDEEEEEEEQEEEEGDSDNESEDSEEDAPTIDKIELSKKETYFYKIIDKFYKTINPAKITLMIDIIEGRADISLRLLDWFVTRYANKYKIRYIKVDKELPQDKDKDKKKEKEKEKDKNNKKKQEEKKDKEEKDECTDLNTFEQSIDSGFNVHISYKAQLKSYKKKYFDPFRRRKKFKYFFDKQKNIYLCTTICQLNFFKWAFNNHVIEYVMSKYKTIIKAMGNSNKQDKTRKQKALNLADQKEVEKEKEQTDNKKTQELKIIKQGVKIKALKKETANDVKIVLSFD
ncbi:MAG: hypothetical protein Barrevirus23_1 [Barrevirus sp.]|uniref:Uncharacterized protein n=1 Tax=Barrevirus sp. TaxID=2487763 RepID=A0A3G4ZSF5_9VIRU|nr:MAG: hypothetical protein Barrevirus23_1 [Barrevirus sp.]